MKRTAVMFALLLLAPGLVVAQEFKQIPAYDAARLVTAIQQALTDHGYDPGPADGQWGAKTEEALQALMTGREIDSSDNRAALDKLGFGCFYSYGDMNFQLECPSGCESSLMITQDGPVGSSVTCPDRETFYSAPFVRPE